MNRPTEQCRVQVSELQRRLAHKATTTPQHRFTNLYDVLTWEPLLVWAFDKLLTNSGARTAGIDGMDKRTAQRQRERILAELRQALKTKTYQPAPVRRVYIPKANGKSRPIGIPTLIDRTVQMMVKAVLEPIFESDFRQESHGFRPQRSCHTALAQLHLRTSPERTQMKWVIEGDITGCFDHIQHTTLMRLLRRRIHDAKLLRLIWAMLRAGVMEGTLFKRTTAGTPQGGIVSPLLANIYLHEIDQWMYRNYTGLSPLRKAQRRKKKDGNAIYIRYADDFVVGWNGTRQGAERLKQELATFLATELGLELSATKTRITHVTDGYDFLGHTIKRYYEPRSNRSALIIRPSEKSVQKLKQAIKTMTQRSTTRDGVSDKIKALNALVRGWANYFRYQASSRTFGYVAHYVFQRMECWLRKKTGQGKRTIYRQYYHLHNSYRTWVAGTMALYHPKLETPIIRHRFRYTPNPYLNTAQEVEPPMHHTPLPTHIWKGTHNYGGTWTEIRRRVIERDNHQCRRCGQGGHIEVHHIQRWKPGMAHDVSNLISLCGACHRQTRNPNHEIHRSIARIPL